jgi:RNA polymerase sigma-70 factor (ECF subfamily)
MIDTRTPDAAGAQGLLDRHLPMLRGYARHLMAKAPDADDLVQDICVAVLSDPALLMRGEDPGAYLRGIARHLASRHLRRRHRERMIEHLIDLAWQEPDEPAHQAEDEGRALAACLGQLSARLRDLIAWRYDDGLNASEIAERLRTSSDAVRMMLGRTRQALAKCIGLRLADRGGTR